MAEQIIDSIKKFGASFQSKTIAGLLSDKAFLEQIVDIVDKNYYESPADQWVVTEIIDYYHNYKTLPSIDAFKVRCDTVQDETLKTSIKEHLKSAFIKLRSDDLTFVKEQFLEFCKNQKLKTAIIESVDLLQLGQYEQIKHLVDTALKAGAERNLGHDYIKDFDHRMSDMARDSIPTNWDLVDDLMDGGLAAGELGVIVGAAGGGKSWCLAKLGAEAMRQGKNVIYYTLELTETYIGRRFDACFTGVDFQDIPSNKEKIKPIVDAVKGNLKIKYFPIKTISANSIKIHAERVAMMEWKPDMIIVDYADILRPLSADKNSNSYKEVGSIYEELKMVAGELQIPIWTASQANRGAAEDDIIQGHSVADSYRKIMTADFVMSLSRKIADKTANTARFHVIKNRFGADGITLLANMNTANGDIQMYLEKSEEGQAIMQSMKDGEQNSKKALHSKLQNFLNSKKQQSKNISLESDDDDDGF